MKTAKSKSTSTAGYTSYFPCEKSFICVCMQYDTWEKHCSCKIPNPFRLNNKTNGTAKTYAVSNEDTNVTVPKHLWNAISLCRITFPLSHVHLLTLKTLTVNTMPASISVSGRWSGRLCHRALSPKMTPQLSWPQKGQICDSRLKTLTRAVSPWILQNSTYLFFKRDPLFRLAVLSCANDRTASSSLSVSSLSP